MKLLARLEKNPSFWFLFIVSIIFVVLRLPSLFEPYWYGDEGIYQAVGMLVNSGASLYSEAWDNKPPLFLSFYALFNSDQFILRTISLIFGLFSVWLIFLIGKRLLNENKIAIFVSTFVFAFIFGTVIIEGNIANTENLILFPILGAVYISLLALDFKKSAQVKNYFFAGVLLSLAFLSKIVAVFDFMALFIFLFAISLKDLKLAAKNKLLPLFLGFTLPVLLTFVYFLTTNNFKDFMDAFLLSNVGYVGKENSFIIPQGFLIFKTILLGIYVAVVLALRNKISKNLLFILLWFGFTLFSAFFSQRPYMHYLIMFLPSFALMIGAVIENKKERFFLLGLLILSYLVINNSFKLEVGKLDTKISKYYKNYIDYSLGKKDASSYQAFFDRNTPRDYALASYIKENTNDSDKVFIWGNNAMVYKLADKTPILRYTVAYHITGFPEGITDMKNAIETKKPKLIIIMPSANEPFPLPLTGYNEKIDIRGATVYEKIL